jgi:hypothetical protein
MIGLLGKRSGIHSFTRRHEGSPLATAIFGTHHSLSTRLTPLSYQCMKTLSAEATSASTTSLHGAMPCPQGSNARQANPDAPFLLANAVLKGTNLICM